MEQHLYTKYTARSTSPVTQARRQQVYYRMIHIYIAVNKGFFFIDDYNGGLVWEQFCSQSGIYQAQLKDIGDNEHHTTAQPRSDEMQSIYSAEQPHFGLLCYPHQTHHRVLIESRYRHSRHLACPPNATFCPISPPLNDLTP